MGEEISERRRENLGQAGIVIPHPLTSWRGQMFLSRRRRAIMPIVEALLVADILELGCPCHFVQTNKQTKLLLCSAAGEHRESFR